MKLDIDISHIMTWQGRLTGIERVEYHLTEYYYQQNYVRFVAWDSAQKCFIEIGRPDVKQLILNRPFSIEPHDNQDIFNSTTKRIIAKLNHKLRKPKLSDDRYRLSAERPVLVLAGLWDKTDYILGLKQLQAGGASLVHVVYDMIPILQPQYVVDFLPPIFKEYMLTVLPLCKGILAISESTARDTAQVLEDHGLSTPPITAFRLGDDLPAEQPKKKPAEDIQDFLLNVSTIESRKNHMLLYYLYKLAAEKGEKLPNMVIVGKSGWHTEDFIYLVERDSAVKDKIKILNNTDDGELCWLYKNCKGVIFPSFYEGWGLPVAEALRYGKLVLSSKTSSLTEVGGTLVDYFSPNSADEVLELILGYLKNPRKLETREKEIATKYQTTSWQNAALQFDNKLQAFF